MTFDSSSKPKAEQNPYTAPVTNDAAPNPEMITASAPSGKMPGAVIALLVLQIISMVISLLGAIANPSKLSLA